MHRRHQFGMLAIILVLFQQHLPRRLIQRGFRIRVDQETLDRDEDVRDPVLALPVLLERVHANLSRFRDVGVEYFGHEPACNKKGGLFYAR